MARKLAISLDQKTSAVSSASFALLIVKFFSSHDGFSAQLSAAAVHKHYFFKQYSRSFASFASDFLFLRASVSPWFVLVAARLLCGKKVLVASQCTVSVFPPGSCDTNLTTSPRQSLFSP